MDYDNNKHVEEEYTINGYLFGFILAVVLTFLSFIPVMNDMLHQWTVSGKIIYLLGMAFLQILVQSYYFLHLQHGADAKWKVWTYIFGLSAAAIVIGGSWWAIQHLNYNMMGGSGRIVTPAVIETHNTEPVKTESNTMATEASTSITPVTPMNNDTIVEKSPIANPVEINAPNGSSDSITIVPVK